MLKRLSILALVIALAAGPAAWLAPCALAEPLADCATMAASPASSAPTKPRQSPMPWCNGLSCTTVAALALLPSAPVTLQSSFVSYLVEPAAWEGHSLKPELSPPIRFS